MSRVWPYKLASNLPTSFHLGILLQGTMMASRISFLLACTLLVTGVQSKKVQQGNSSKRGK